ncbi:MAG: helix-turn-helix transcriptional regulator [Pseudomonadota bacterium]
MAAQSKRSSAPTQLDLRVSERVRALRTQRGLSQGAVASHLGIVHQQYHKYEAGLNRLSAGMLIRIAEVLECTVADLIPPEMRGTGDLGDSIRIDMIKQELVDYILQCGSETRLLAIRTLLMSD